VEKINSFFAQYQTLSTTNYAAKTQEFKQRIQQHLTEIGRNDRAKKAEADVLPEDDMQNRGSVV